MARPTNCPTLELAEEGAKVKEDAAGTNTATWAGHWFNLTDEAERIASGSRQWGLATVWSRWRWIWQRVHAGILVDFQWTFRGRWTVDIADLQGVMRCNWPEAGLKLA